MNQFERWRDQLGAVLRGRRSTRHETSDPSGAWAARRAEWAVYLRATRE